MSPKKRNRDVEVKPEPDPDQLDKDELKGMLEQSLDEKAELVAKMEEQKKEFEAKVEKMKLERIFYYFCDRKDNDAKATRWVYYPNFNVAQQAKTANVEELLDVEDCLSCPGINKKVLYYYYYPVETCTELVDIFENGLKAGSVLYQDHLGDSLFSVIIATTDSGDEDAVAPGTEKQYLVIAARSHVGQYSVLLARYLNRATTLGPRLETYHSLSNSKDHTYEDALQNRLKALGEREYNPVLRDIWIPDKPGRDGRERQYKVELDLDRMVEVTVGSGQKTKIGFWK